MQTPVHRHTKLVEQTNETMSVKIDSDADDVMSDGSSFHRLVSETGNVRLRTKTEGRCCRAMD